MVYEEAMRLNTQKYKTSARQLKRFAVDGDGVNGPMLITARIYTNFVQAHLQMNKFYKKIQSLIKEEVTEKNKSSHTHFQTAETTPTSLKESQAEENELDKNQGEYISHEDRLETSISQAFGSIQEDSEEIVGSVPRSHEPHEPVQAKPHIRPRRVTKMGTTGDDEHTQNTSMNDAVQRILEKCGRLNTMLDQLHTSIVTA